MKSTQIIPTTNNSKSWSFLRYTLTLLALACFGFLPRAQAVNPPPDGGYPGFNTAAGQKALFSLTTGAGNTAVGSFSLLSNTDGSFNTGVGAGALLLNVGGTENSAFGAGALVLNTTGNANTAIGYLTLNRNTIGSGNTAVGEEALFNNTTGIQNTATGADALSSNIDGVNNTATGAGTLLFNTTGDDNTATGVRALGQNTTGGVNTANGLNALAGNTTGSNNTAVGVSALSTNITGTGNTALGVLAGFNVVAANNVIAIGHGGANISDTCFIGNIRGVTTANANAIPVLVDSAGQLGTASSSRRFKKEIEPMDQASESILALKPVTFHYKSDNTNTPQFGLIAEEVAEVNPDLVVRDDKGDIYTVRYEAVNAMLLNEFLKEQKKVEEQASEIQQHKTRISELSKGMEILTAQLKEQAAQIQKVSAQLELKKPAPRTVANKMNP